MTPCSLDDQPVEGERGRWQPRQVHRAQVDGATEALARGDHPRAHRALDYAREHEDREQRGRHHDAEREENAVAYASPPCETRRCGHTLSVDEAGSECRRKAWGRGHLSTGVTGRPFDTRIGYGLSIPFNMSPRRAPWPSSPLPRALLPSPLAGEELGETTAMNGKVPPIPRPGCSAPKPFSFRHRRREKGARQRGWGPLPRGKNLIERDVIQVGRSLSANHARTVSHVAHMENIDAERVELAQVASGLNPLCAACASAAYQATSFHANGNARRLDASA